MLGPVVAALVGIGVIALWRSYVRDGLAGWALPIILVASGVLEVDFASASRLWQARAWNRGFSQPHLGARWCWWVRVCCGPARLWRTSALSVAMVGLLIAPAVWSLTSVQDGAGGTWLPAASPGGFRGNGGGAPAGFPGGAPNFRGGGGGAIHLLGRSRINLAGPVNWWLAALRLRPRNGTLTAALHRMGILDSLLGNQQVQQELQGYVQRYRQGPPDQGYSDQEVALRYQQVAPQLPAQDYRQAAEQAFNNMPPDQRQQFGQYVEQQLQSSGASTSSFNQGQSNNPQQYQSSGYLAQQTAQLHQQQPQLLTQLLTGGDGGSGGGLMSNPAVKSALAGIAANAVSNALSGGGGSKTPSLF